MTATGQLHARRGWIVAASLLVAIAAGLAFCEWRGWPFLAAPLQRALTKTLERPVNFAASYADVSEHMEFRVHLLGGVHITTPFVEIGAPSWSRASHMLLARDVELSLRYGDLWRVHKGQPLRIERLRAATLDLHLERRADGQASWQFGKRPTNAPPVQPPIFDDLQVDDATIQVRDALLAISADGRGSLMDATRVNTLPGVARAQGAAHAVLQLHARGSFRDKPLTVALLSSGVLAPIAGSMQTPRIPVQLTMGVGTTHLSFKGSAIATVDLRGLSGRFELQGDSLATIGDLMGITLPTTPTYRARGILVRDGALWRARLDNAVVGTSHLNGALTYDRGRPVPLLAGRLGGARLALVDLGPALGTTAISTVAQPTTSAPKRMAPHHDADKLLPDRPFDLAALRVMDANVLFDIAEVDLNTAHLEPLRPLHGHLVLNGGVLAIHDIATTIGGGDFGGALRLDGRTETALWNSDVRWQRVRLERWIHQARKHNAPPYISGQLFGRAVLEGQGKSTAQILATMQGTVRSELSGGGVSHLFVEAAGLNVGETVGVLLKGDDVLPVQCAVVDLVAQHGTLHPRLVVLDTEDSAIWIGGELSMADEQMDLRAVVSPKDFALLSLRTPLRMQGTFSAPRISLEKKAIAKKLAAAVVLAFVTPVAALLSGVEPGATDQAKNASAGCMRLAATTARAAAGRIKPPPSDVPHPAPAHRGGTSQRRAQRTSR